MASVGSPTAPKTRVMLTMPASGTAAPTEAVMLASITTTCCQTLRSMPSACATKSAATAS